MLNGPSWIEPSARTGPLVYVSDQYEKTVFIYSYPRGKLVGTLSGFGQPDGECADSAGNVWITDGLASKIIEYAHGSTSVKATLSDASNSPYACAVDPVSGALAVVNFAHNPVPGSLSVYRKARGAPQVYTDGSLDVPFFDAYDSSGNLYVDGITGFYSPQFALVRFRNKAFTNIELDHGVTAPGGVVVVGRRVNVGDAFRYTHAVYGFSVGGTKGRLIGTTHLDGTNVVEEFDIDGSSLVATNIDQTVGSVMVFHYPKGGAPERTFGTRTLEGPVGLVISR